MARSNRFSLALATGRSALAVETAARVADKPRAVRDPDHPDVILWVATSTRGTGGPWDATLTTARCPWCPSRAIRAADAEVSGHTSHEG